MKLVILTWDIDQRQQKSQHPELKMQKQLFLQLFQLHSTIIFLEIKYWITLSVTYLFTS